MSYLKYKDVITFVNVTTSGYRGNKIMQSQIDVPCIFLQNTGMVNVRNQENYDADAICYPKPDNDFILESFNRLEGVYIMAPLFGVSDERAWFKVSSVNVNRDHLLKNKIDNIELLLKKTRPISGVS